MCITPLPSFVNATQERIVAHIKSSLKAGQSYFKSKYIAQELGISTHTVGTNMTKIARVCKDFTVQKWGRASATTWRVIPVTI